MSFNSKKKMSFNSIETRRGALHRPDVHVESHFERDEVDVRVTLEEERRLTYSHRSREVVLEHVEVCAQRAFFWKTVCLLCDE